MHLRRPWIALGILAAFTAGAAVVYKWTDTDGVVHYSDQAVPGAERIVTSTPTNNGIGRAVQGPGPAAQAKTAGRLDYRLSIASPAKEQVFFGDDAVPVRLEMDPALKPDQEIIWNLNGSQLTDQPPTATNFTLSTLARGTYVIAAIIKDAVTGETRAADSVTFYVRQPSSLAPLNPLHK